MRCSQIKATKLVTCTNSHAAHHNKTIPSWEIEMGKVPVPGLEMLGGLGCHSASVKPSVRLGIGRMSGRDVRSLEPCPHIH